MGAYKVSNEAFMRYVVARAIDYVTPTPKSKSTLCLLLSSSFLVRVQCFRPRSGPRGSMPPQSTNPSKLRVVRLRLPHGGGKALRPERHRTSRSVAHFFQPDCARLLRGLGEYFPLERRLATGSGRTFLGMRPKSPDRTGPILPAALHAEDDPGGARAKHPAALRPVPGRGARAPSILAAGGPGAWGHRQGRTRTTSTATGRPWNAVKPHPQSGEEHGRIFCHAECPRVAVQGANRPEARWKPVPEPFAFGGRREPRRPDAAMARISRGDSTRRLCCPRRAGSPGPVHRNVI
jgi:hypothetical protein